MNEVRFLLKSPTSKTDSIIFLHYSYKGNRFKISTGFKANKESWNFKKQRIREVAGTLHKEINRGLKVREDYFLKAILAVENREISVSAVRDYYESLLDDTKAIEIDFVSFFEGFIDKHEARRGYQNCKPYIMCLNRLKDFKNDTHTPLSFNKFNYKFYDDLIEYLEGKQYSLNTIGSVVKRLKQILNKAVRAGYQTDLVFRDFKVMQEDVYNVYLSTEEIQQIYELEDLTKTEEMTRDLFVVGCYTGFRVKNFMNLSKASIQGKFLEVFSVKGGPRVTIPIHPYVKEVFDKYDYELPVISEPVFRKAIKRVCKKAKIDQEVEKARTTGGKRVIETLPKYKMVSTHTARRSFATNAYLAGIPHVKIMMMTGHKNIKTFLKYIGITSQENAEDLQNHQFFN